MEDFAVMIAMTMPTALRRMMEVLVAELVSNPYATGPLQSSMNAYQEMDRRQMACQLPPITMYRLIN